jgi:hypothetical protein
VLLGDTSFDYCQFMFISGLAVQSNVGTISYTSSRRPVEGITNWRKLHDVERHNLYC